MLVLGALGDHGHHVQGHVVGARRAVGDPKMHQEMVEQIAQDPQMLPDHATHIAANVSKMDGNGLATCGYCVSKLILIAL